MTDTLSQFIALAPTMIPTTEGEMEISLIRYPVYQDFLSINNMDDQVFGPRFDERMGDFCKYARFLGGKSTCEKMLASNEFDGFEPMSTKLLLHLEQMVIEERF